MTIAANADRAAAERAAVDDRALQRGGTVGALVQAAKGEGERVAAAYRKGLAWELDNVGVTPPAEVVGWIRAGMDYHNLSADDVAADLETLRTCRETVAAIRKADEQIRKDFDRSPVEYNAAADEQSQLADEAAERFLAKMGEFRVLANRMRQAVDSRNRRLGAIPAVHPRVAELIERPPFRGPDCYFNQRGE